jgi:hypothetical protein
LFDTGHNRKTTPTTRRRPRSSRSAPGLRVLSYDAELKALQMLADRREELPALTACGVRNESAEVSNAR